MKHWTDDVISWQSINRYPSIQRWPLVTVLANSAVEPYIVGQTEIHIGILWLQEYLPTSYAGFLAVLMTKSHEWFSRGQLSDCREPKEGDQ